MARRRAAPEKEVDRNEEDVDYVECPMCHGAKRGCKYCMNHGDVHPDDVDAIVETAQTDKNKKLVIGVGAGALAILLILAIVMIAKSGNSNNAAATKKVVVPQSTPETISFGTKGPPPGYSDQAKTIWHDMLFEKKCKNWAKVIELGQQALPLTQDDIQKKNIQALIDEAQAKKGTK